MTSFKLGDEGLPAPQPTPHLALSAPVRHVQLELVCLDDFLTQGVQTLHQALAAVFFLMLCHFWQRNELSTALEREALRVMRRWDHDMSARGYGNDVPGRMEMFGKDTREFRGAGTPQT